LTKPANSALRKQAEEFLSSRRFQEAISTIRSMSPQDPFLLNRAGDVLQKAGLISDAVKSWTQAASLLVQEGFPGRAGGVLAKAIRSVPDRDDLRILQADAYLRARSEPDARLVLNDLASRETEVAEVALRKLVEITPSDAALRRRLVANLVGKGNVAAADTHWRPAIQGMICAGMLGEALALCDAGLKSGSRSVELRLMRGRALLALDKPILALEALRELASEIPGSPEIVGLVGECHLALGEAATARDTLSELLGPKSADTDARLSLIRFQSLEGRIDEALAELDAVLSGPAESATFLKVLDSLEEIGRRRPDNTAVLLMTARVQQNLGRRDAAARTYFRVAGIHRNRGEEELAEAVGVVASSLYAVASPIPRSEARALTRAEIADRLDRAAGSLKVATALVVATATEFGLACGLPDYRDQESLWQAFPSLRFAGLRFEDLARADRFDRNAEAAWGFYAHRRQDARNAPAHSGHRILRNWANRARDGAFAVTSSTDGLLSRAGWPLNSILEMYGGLDWNQCTSDCRTIPFPADDQPVNLIPDAIVARPPLPHCPNCGLLARPNIQMFDDPNWETSRFEQQLENFHGWLEHAMASPEARLVVVETVDSPQFPSIWPFISHLLQETHATRIRILGPNSPVSDEAIELPFSSAEALELLEGRLK